MRRVAAILGLGLALALGAAAPSGAIVGGKTTERAWPWMGYFETSRPELDLEQLGVCGLSLLAPRWAVTAAHCMYQDTSLPLTRTPDAILAVTVGRHLRSDRASGHRAGVVRSIVHERYTGVGGRYDLALLELDRELPGPYLRLPGAGEDALWSAGAETTLLGWGIEVWGPPPQWPDALKEGPEPILDDDACAAIIGGAWEEGTQLCARDVRATACLGDSGGPIVAQAQDGSFRHIGVTSLILFEDDPCELSQTTVYTNVAGPELRDWIAARVPGAVAG